VSATGKWRNSTEKERALGYPHELILYALAKSGIVIERRYRTGVRLFASLLRTVLKEKTAKVQVPSKADATVRMIESLAKTSLLKRASEDYRNRLHQLIEEYSTSQSAPSLDALREFVEDGVLLHVLSRELGKGTLFTAEDMEKIPQALNETDGGLAGLLAFSVSMRNCLKHALAMSGVPAAYACCDCGIP
jgi:hypothetical protein